MEKIVYGYVRVSGAGQAGEGKDGPVRQRLAITEFCAKNQLSVPEFREDLGVSGTKDGLDRPGLFSILTDAERLKEAGDSVCLVVENMDRFARDLIISECLVKELSLRSVALYATNLGFEDQVTSEAEPGRKLVRQILGALAEYEKSAIVLKLRCARERIKREKGKCDGARGFGCDSKMTSGKSERIVLNLIGELRAGTDTDPTRLPREMSRTEKRGAAWRTIAMMLNASAIQDRSGNVGRWTADKLYKIWWNHLERQKQPKEKVILWTPV